MTFFRIAGSISVPMAPLSLILRKVNASYEWGMKKYKLNYLLFMDDLKLFSKSGEQMETLVRTVHIFSNGIGMEFGMKTCGILTTKERIYIIGNS